MGQIVIVTNNRLNAQVIYERIEVLEKGLRALAMCYHEHSNDKSSFERITDLIENIIYRLNASKEQYLVYVSGLHSAEKTILAFFKSNYDRGIQMGSKSFVEHSNELALSSYFDNIIFNLCSVFDYLGHILSYIHYRNIDRTFDWDKFKKKINESKDFENEEFLKTIDEINRAYVQRLYSYRSRLIHRKRDKHILEHQIDESFKTCKVIVRASLTSKKMIIKMKGLNPETEKSHSYSLNYVLSELIHLGLNSLEEVIIYTYNHVSKQSDWPNSLSQKETIFSVHRDKENGKISPVSEAMWNRYLKEKDSFSNKKKP